MSYFDDLDAWLTAVLLFTEEDKDEEQWFARVKKQLKEKVLESYRNGQKAPASVSAKGKEEAPRPKYPFRRKR